MAEPLVGIVILNWNNAADSAACLDSLAAVRYPADRRPVWLVDNGSSDGSGDRLAGRGDARLVSLPQNRGFAGGNNPAIRLALAAGCDYVLLLNNDTVLDPAFLGRLVAFAERSPRAGLVAPLIRYADPPHRVWAAGGSFFGPRRIGALRGMGEPDRGQYRQPERQDYAVGTCLLVRRTVFEQIGLLDESFFFFEEDVDFCLRAAQAGWEIWLEPSAVIAHKVSASTRGNKPWQLFLGAESRVVFFRKHIRGWRVPVVIGLELLRLARIAVHSALQREPAAALSYLRGLWSGLRKPLINRSVEPFERTRSEIPTA